MHSPAIFSPERWYSDKDADEIGQQWIADCCSYNGKMINLSHPVRLSFSNCVISQYNPEFANAILGCNV